MGEKPHNIKKAETKTINYQPNEKTRKQEKKSERRIK